MLITIDRTELKIVSTQTATKKPGLRERKKRATREAILKAATNLFARDGFDATSVEKIAEHANLSRQTCFNYFPPSPRSLRR
jgi:AcrR family transcriptional regulator